jgi:hypothetical protein
MVYLRDKVLQDLKEQLGRKEIQVLLAQAQQALRVL